MVVAARLFVAEFGDPVKFALQRLLMNIWIPFRDASHHKSAPACFQQI